MWCSSRLQTTSSCACSKRRSRGRTRRPLRRSRPKKPRRRDRTADGSRVVLEGRTDPGRDRLVGLGVGAQHHLLPPAGRGAQRGRSEEHTSELQSPCNLVCRLLLEKKKNTYKNSKLDT